MTLPDRSTLLATYGGAKQNYGGLRPVDPSVDDDADDLNKLKADAAMMTRTIPRVDLAFHWPTAGGVALLDYEAVWRTMTPTAPTITRTGTGVFTVAFATPVLDELGASHPLALARGWARPRAARIAPWHAGTAYAAGALVIPTTENGRLYRCTVAGTSHAATEPTWPTTLTNTVVDGTCTFRCEEAYPDGAASANVTPVSASSFTVRTFRGGVLADLLGSAIDCTFTGGA